jgi:hypothetical protein
LKFFDRRPWTRCLPCGQLPGNSLLGLGIAQNAIRFELHAEPSGVLAQIELAKQFNILAHPPAQGGVLPVLRPVELQQPKHGVESQPVFERHPAQLLSQTHGELPQILRRSVDDGEQAIPFQAGRAKPQVFTQMLERLLVVARRRREVFRCAIQPGQGKVRFPLYYFRQEAGRLLWVVLPERSTVEVEKC